MNKAQKFIILFVLFIVPLLFYIFLSAGINNFAKLPVVTENVIDISEIDKGYRFKKNISIVLFLGKDINRIKGSVFNLNQKIYKPFYGFKDFQVIAIAPKGNNKGVEKLQKEIGAFTNMVKWRFVYGEEEEIKALYKSFNTNQNLDEDLYSSKAFLIDKEGKLRGRTDDKDTANGKLYGYNMQSVGELNDKMKDDVKVVLAEYRLALKKNNADREI
ncbi:thioredoxin domain-containing protein [Tenacibaculum maritimum]|uniref:membrane protein n=6 Tax=Tenacibaculum maritimum TaxID=107401 RepID=UPI000464C692|nr:membrane protein [Tenacibaculum maritimum]MCD9580824.1 hypothetical protein [Tenacibaculum maritimum]MCD9584056.1 hypothetical protein [Tenacibaculum maritimum]MCD9610388.1 hypothetical protein [Tenacibaculum maritimum]MCD9620070.1 hypothetical protein [Tenacibaculum maritimum]MCD9626424.1 hypothetical protein [Tenacibaculum maritimum]